MKNLIREVEMTPTQNANASIVNADKQHHLHPLTSPASLRDRGPTVVTRAEGVYFYLSDGRRVMDTTSSLWNVNIGYGNERVCRAGYEAMKELSSCHAIFGRTNPWAARLSEKMAEISPEQFKLFFFASSGSEAIESSIKLALHFWKQSGQPAKRIIISRKRSYHGNTIFAAGVTGIDMFHKQFGLPASPNIHHTESAHWYLDGNGRTKDQFYEDAFAALETQILALGPQNIAAFVGEPIQTGMVIPPDYYWPRIREICDKHDILLISDEVVSGFGKSGRMFAFQTFGFEPDMFAMAKGITSGYFPVSAVAIGRRVADVIQKGEDVFAHVFTNSGHPVGAAIALENIAVIQDLKLVERVRDDLGPYFAQRLAEISEFSCIAYVRSRGIMGAFNVDSSGGARTATPASDDALMEEIVAAAWRRGMVIRAGGLCLPMIITRDQIDEVIEILKASIREVWDGR